MTTPDDTGQDPRPEPKWLFRRITVWTMLLLNYALTAAVVFWAPPGWASVALWAQVTGLVVLFVYLVAPSASEIIAAIAAWRAAPRSGDAP